MNEIQANRQICITSHFTECVPLSKLLKFAKCNLYKLPYGYLPHKTKLPSYRTELENKVKHYDIIFCVNNLNAFYFVNNTD